jgi:hypothetical protein
MRIVLYHNIKPEEAIKALGIKTTKGQKRVDAVAEFAGKNMHKSFPLSLR